MKRPRRLLVLLTALLLLGLAPASARGAGRSPGTADVTVGVPSPAFELAEKYVPIVELRQETDPPCDTAEDMIGSLVFALLIPFVAMGGTFLYFDLGVREETEPARPRRSWPVWKPIGSSA